MVDNLQTPKSRQEKEKEKNKLFYFKSQGKSWIILVCNFLNFFTISLPASHGNLRNMWGRKKNSGQLPATHRDVFTLTSPVCIVCDYVILDVCKTSPFPSSLFPPSHLYPLSTELKERRSYPPDDLWCTSFLRLHISYITCLNQGCCSERFRGGTQSLSNSWKCYREDLANPPLNW